MYVNGYKLELQTPETLKLSTSDENSINSEEIIITQEMREEILSELRQL